jgi:hypothetical protein
MAVTVKHGTWTCVVLQMSVDVSEKQTVSIIFSEFGVGPERDEIEPGPVTTLGPPPHFESHIHI